MYYDFGHGYTAAAVQESIDSKRADLGTVHPRDLHRFAISLEENQGQLAALQEVEGKFADLEQWATEQGWDDTLIVAQQLAIVSRLALRRVDDIWSGRNNDARRAFHDGWRDAVEHVYRQVENKLTDIVRERRGAVE